MINVILADHQRIYRIGMAAALAAEDDIRIIGQPYSIDQLFSALTKFRTHVLVMSSAFLGQLPEIKEVSAQHQTAILFLEESANAYLPQRLLGVDGVMQRSADESTVVRSIRHLARGGRVLRYVRNQALDFQQDPVGLRVRRRLSHPPPPSPPARSELPIATRVGRGSGGRAWRTVRDHAGKRTQAVCAACGRNRSRMVAIGAPA